MQCSAVRPKLGLIVILCAEPRPFTTIARLAAYYRLTPTIAEWRTMHQPCTAIVCTEQALPRVAPRPARQDTHHPL